MALMIRGFRVVVAPNGKKRLLTLKIFKKWTNDEAQTAFDHDFFSAKEWKKYLDNYKMTNGKHLPRFTADGEPVAYQVYFWGTPNWVKEAYNKGGLQEGFVSLFPGNDAEGNKLDVAEYGILKK